MSYADDTGLKQRLGIKNDRDDAILEDFIAYAQGIIDSGTRRTFEADDDSTRKFDAIANVRGLSLHLDKDLAKITKITNGDDDEIESTEYVTEPRNAIVDGKPIYEIRILVSSGKSWNYDGDPENAIEITGKWAYSESAPRDVKFATEALAAFLYRQKSSHQDIDRPIKTASGAIILPASWPNTVQAVIDSYKQKRAYPIT